MANNHLKIHKGLNLAPQSSAPSSPNNGDIYYDSSLAKFRKYENGVWSDLDSGSVERKNIIINSNFDFWQRGSASISLTSGVRADRFHTWRAGTTAPPTITVAQSTDVPDSISTYSLKHTDDGAGVSIGTDAYRKINYTVEGYDAQQLVGKVFTLSFYVKSSVTGTYCVAFKNSGKDKSYIAEYTVNVANTWEKKDITIGSVVPTAGTWDYTTGVGLEVAWVLAAGTNYQTTADAWQSGNYFSTSSQVNWLSGGGATFYLSQVQLAPNTTSIEYRRAGITIAEELSLCQRYYEKSYALTTVPGTATSIGSMIFLRTDGGGGSTFPFNTRKRVAPTMVVYSPSGSSGVTKNLVTTADTSSTPSGTEANFYMAISAAASLTAYQGHFTADAGLSVS